MPSTAQRPPPPTPTKKNKNKKNAPQCAVERRTGKVQMTLVWNAPGRKEAGAELSRLLKALKAADPENVCGLDGDGVDGFGGRGWGRLGLV